MTDNKNFQSIDELFRKTFNDLPEVPAPNGWDTPSERVWQTVQTGIETRHTHWSITRKIFALVAISAVVATAIFLVYSPNQSAAAEQPAAIEKPVTVPAAANGTASDHTESAATIPMGESVAPTTVQNAVGSKAPSKPFNSGVAGKNAALSVTEPKVAIESNNGTILTDPQTIEAPKVEKAERNTSDSKPPNSVEKRKLMEQMKGTWQQPLQTIPYFYHESPKSPFSSPYNWPFLKGKSDGDHQ